MDGEDKPKDDQMNANQNETKPSTFNQVLLRGCCTVDSASLDSGFVSYVRLGSEVIARTKNGGYISYFNVR